MDGREHRENIESQLAGMFGTTTTQGTLTSGSFTYSEDDLQTIINNWLDLAASYRSSIDNANQMARIEPPADDFASALHAAQANRSGESYRDYVAHNRDYCLQQAQLFQDALNDYLGVEHSNADSFDESAPRGPQPGV